MPRISSTFETAHKVRFCQFPAEMIDILLPKALPTCDTPKRAHCEHDHAQRVLNCLSQQSFCLHDLLSVIQKPS